MFPDGFRNDIQIIATVLSTDPGLDSDVIAVCAAGAALAVSDIPFDKNVAAVRVGRDEDGKFITNPTLEQYESGGMEIVVAGTLDAVMMVEGGAKEITEDVFLDAVAFAHEEIKKIVKAIDQLAKKAGKKKRELPAAQDRRRRSTRGCARTSKKKSPRRCASSTSSSATRRSTSCRAKRRSRSSAKKDDAHGAER